MQNMDCILNLPYPPIEVTQPNNELAAKLTVLYAGRDSELTDVLQYGYQRILSDEKYAYISDIFECIARTEMRHYEMLGELILLLGADPRVAAQDRGRFVYWNGANVTYSRRIDRMIKDDITAEKRAIAAYNNFLRISADPKVNDVIERIILDEEHHIKLLSSLLDDIY